MGTKHYSEEKRKKQILEATFFLFNQKGYHETKMDDIVKKSKLSKGTIYRFYKSKKELFLNLFDYLVCKFEKEVDSLPCADIPPQVLLDEIIDIFIAHLRNKKNIFLADVQFWSMSDREKEIREKIKRLYDRWTERIEYIFKNLGLSDIDSKIATIALIALFDGFILRAVGEPNLDLEKNVKPVFVKFKKFFL